MVTTSPTAVRKTPQDRASRLAALKSKEFCQGKSNFFMEHQAMWEKEGNKGYDTNVHGWRYAQQVPLPEGEWPNLSKFRGGARDEYHKEEVAQRHKRENRLRQEEGRQRKLIEEELRRQRERLACGWLTSGRNNLQSKADESHASNVQMAICFINSKNPSSKYELKEITAKNTIIDFAAIHCHYNFAAYSPTDGFQLFFAEVDATLESKRRVLQCCAIGPGPHGCCMGCQNQGVLLIHPGKDKFFAGQESFCNDSEWC